MGVTVTGAQELITRLRNLADKVPSNARKTMHRGADKIVQEAMINTPVDTHALEQSIHKEVAYGGSGRLQIDVVAGEGLDYAVEVHENYEGMTPKGPGPGTLEKMKQFPDHHIGSKFLERALKEQEPKLHAAMIASVDGDLK